MATEMESLKRAFSQPTGTVATEMESLKRAFSQPTGTVATELSNGDEL